MVLTKAALYLCTASYAHLSIDVSSELAHATSSRVIRTDLGATGLIADTPMTAAEYASQLSRGVVATWAEFGKTIEAYNKQWYVTARQSAAAFLIRRRLRLR